jgi:signal transduction histidine kinase
LKNIFFHSLIIIQLLSLTVLCQNNSNKDLLELINKTTNNDSLIIGYNQLAWNNRNISPYKSIEFAQKAIDLANQNNINKYLSTSLNFLGVAYRNIQLNDNAVECFKQALQQSKKMKDTVQIAYSFNNIGGMYRIQSKYLNAIENILIAYNIFEKKKDSLGLSYCSTNLGSLYQYQADFENALYYFRKAEVIREKYNDLNGLASVWSSIGDVYNERQMVDSALIYYKKVESIYPKVKSCFQNAALLGALGRLFYQTGDYNKALQYVDKSLVVGFSIDEKDQIVRSYSTLGKIYTRQNKFAKAEKYLFLALDMAMKINLDARLLECYRSISDLFYSMGNFKDALHYEQKYISLYEKVLKQEKTQKITQLTTRFQLSQKENENKLLRQSNEYQLLEIKRRNEWLVFLVVIILLILLFLFVLYRLYRLKVRANLKISEQKAELQKVNEELTESNLTLEKFFSIIAHDLNNPFSTLIGFSSFLMDDFDDFSDKEKKEMVEHIHKVAKNSQVLLQNLLNWSRSQTGKLKVNKVKFLLNEAINEEMPLLKSIAINKEVEILLNVEPNPEVFADKDMIKTTIRNLVTNAIKYSYRKGTIEIKTACENNAAKISIMDKGIGMDNGIVSNLFKMDNSTVKKGTDKEIGSGLGLLLCKEFVEINNGTITVESKINEGSIFSFTLPVGQ